MAIGSVRNGNCFPQNLIGLRAFWVSSFVPFMALSVRHRLLAGILFAIFHCRSPLRLQQRATRLPGNQTRPTRTLMTGWGIKKEMERETTRQVLASMRHDGQKNRRHLNLQVSSHEKQVFATCSVRVSFLVCFAQRTKPYCAKQKPLPVFVF